MKELAKDIIDNFPDRGQPALSLEPAIALMECVADSIGDYIEIGSEFGGSAVMAGMAMKHTSQAGIIFCIDPFGTKNELEAPDKKYHAFWQNIIHYDLHRRTIAFKQFHPPWPAAIQFRLFAIGFIDGNHSSGAPLADFKALQSRVIKYIMFDNAEKEEVDKAIKYAIRTGQWEEYKLVTYESENEPGVEIIFVVLRRINESNTESS